jgi:cell fate regulator YaaT (PSP1 superfamily)
MSMVMAVSFQRYGRLYYLDPGEHTPAVGDKVLVPTDAGPEVAECIWAPQYVSGCRWAAGVRGPRSEDDLARTERNRARKAEAGGRGAYPASRAADESGRRGLPGPGQPVHHLLSAPHRVDFRALVRDLATLSARVELRQLGARDEARVQGGIGPCGRDLCCATFLRDFEPVSVRMAKDQDLPLNPLKISGACGRLMCCLKYEHPLYVKAQR